MTSSAWSLRNRIALSPLSLLVRPTRTVLLHAATSSGAQLRAIALVAVGSLSHPRLAVIFAGLRQHLHRRFFGRFDCLCSRLNGKRVCRISQLRKSASGTLPCMTYLFPVLLLKPCSHSQAIDQLDPAFQSLLLLLDPLFVFGRGCGFPVRLKSQPNSWVFTYIKRQSFVLGCHHDTSDDRNRALLLELETRL